MLFKLAYKDLRHDWLMTLCQVAAIGSILAPLLLLFSLRYGILQELENKLTNDPKVLSLTLDTSYRLNADFFNDLVQTPEVNFLVPEVTALSALVDLKFPGGVNKVSVIPTAIGDPVVSGSLIEESPITQSKFEPKVLAQDSSKLDPRFWTSSLQMDELFISEGIATARNLKVGDQVQIVVSRILSGKRESSKVSFTVKGIVKERYVNKDSIFVSLNTLCALDDYRSGYNPPLFSDHSRLKTTERYFAKFRLYAKDLDSVIALYYKLVKDNFNVSSKVHEIENVKAIDRVLNFVFLTIASVSGIGGSIAMIGLILSSLKARKRNFVLLRLLGQSNSDITLLVCLEDFLIACSGFVLAFVLYSIGSNIFNQYFEALLNESKISKLSIEHITIFFFSTITIALMLALLSCKYVFLKVSIADVIREV